MSGNRPVDRRFRNANPEAEADVALRLALEGRPLGAATVSVAATRSDVRIAHISGKSMLAPTPLWSGTSAT